MPHRRRKDPLYPLLAGLRVVVPRTADRAGGMVAELRGHGAVPLLLPLIDFEEPESTRDLDEALRMLGEGHFGWIIFTSVTTVRALKQRAAAAGATLPGLIREPTRVAVVGEATKRALEGEGVPVAYLPVADHSSAGLLAEWPVPDDAAPGPAGLSCMLPQADLADALLYEGLMDRGWQVLPVTAYRTVDYPADPGRRITALPAPPAAPQGFRARHSPAPPDAAPADTPILSLPEFAGLVRQGGVDAVVLTSPSVARRIAEVLTDSGTGARIGAAGPEPAAGKPAAPPAAPVPAAEAPGAPPQPKHAVRLVAIGRTTAAETASLGQPAAAVAQTPTPAGIAAALAAAVAGSPVHPSPAERAAL